MIKNFEEVKKQLKELSQIINSFQSETVQLRLIDLIFGAIETEDSAEVEAPDNKGHKMKIRKKKKPIKKSIESKPTAKSTQGKGSVATLTTLAAGDFFNKSRTIKDIIQHCDVNLAKKIKQRDISGKLARMVRAKELIRTKNADGQYEYKKG